MDENLVENLNDLKIDVEDGSNTYNEKKGEVVMIMALMLIK